MKTHEEWSGSLESYLKIDDLVDNNFVDYFVAVRTPACMNNQVIQMGESHSEIDGRSTYPTLKKTAAGWRYAGNCFKGESIKA